ncbi:hypothetical protein [Ramlibacter tataouinensis]|uniref:Uncharacterized protein n=1 Tax=Ramlibacter tataouinensis (strain ATCC BAA-407 / DSM 14655 / LMG 21543 / TTB310) TaxID=365046 RepID=F5XYI0_RAMTT|nr:hypothetical protein [Ramlibacter tataouinensis]AEG93156.1 hypothetical protein Rta_20630 [Ramlibacter tataouinensis TTB310]
MSNTSIGAGPGRGAGNENHDGDPRNKTLGEKGSGTLATSPDDDLLEQAAPDMPAGVAGAPADPGIAKGPQAYPEGPNVENSPWELEAARGNPPPTRQR